MLELKNLVNFRDLGGKVGYNGKTVKYERLLRSGQVVGLSKQEKSFLLDNYNLKNIVDFRDDREVTTTPDDDVANTKYFHIDIMKDTKVKAINMQNIKEHRSPVEMRKFMLDVYSSIMTNEISQKGYHDFVQILLKEQAGSTLFHCFAGKDRTGIAAAIVLHILGVSKEDIIKDYLQTNQQRQEANQAIIAGLVKKGLSAEGEKAILIALSVSEDYLLNAFSVAKDSYGSFDNYIKEAIKINDDEQEQLRQIYLN